MIIKLKMRTTGKILEMPVPEIETSNVCFWPLTMFAEELHPGFFTRF